MNVLVACEYSGVVRDAFIAKGHNAWSCDLLPSENPSLFHYQEDVLDIIDMGWDLMIAHPPCTYLSNADARHLFPKGQLNHERYSKGLEAKEFFMQLLNADIPHICIENPIASKIYELPPYNQIIQPYQYGHPFSKTTCLWLKNLPLLSSTKVLTNYQNTSVVGNWYNKGGKDRQKNRAKTFQGIANAMAEQWSNL